MMTHSMLLQILRDAEARRDDTSLPDDVRVRSGETVGFCNQRMAQDGLSREMLEELAAADV